MEYKEIYTPKEVAEFLKVDVQTIRKYIRDGKIKAHHLGKRMIRIPYKEIEYLINGKEETNDK